MKYAKVKKRTAMEQYSLTHKECGLIFCSQTAKNIGKTTLECCQCSLLGLQPRHEVTMTSWASSNS